MRTKAHPEDGRATARVVLDLWARFEQRCANSNEPMTFVHLAAISGVEPETLRVLVRRSQSGLLKTGPSFTTVARVAVELGADLDALGRMVTDTKARRQ